MPRPYQWRTTEDRMSGIKRFGLVIRLRPDQRDLYLALHADDHPGVRDLLVRYHIRNFSIFLRQLPDGDEYLFGYYEYVGEDYEAEMQWLAAEPRNRAWLARCSPCQVPLPGERGWAVMREIYHND